MAGDDAPEQPERPEQREGPQEQREQERPAQGRPVSDPAALKALAHPLRLRILRRLGTAGPATSTTLASALGENTGTLSYHLRQLERGGFVEDVTERPGSRERWWRAVRGLDLRSPPQDELTEAERVVMNELDRMRRDEDLRILRLAHRRMAERAERSQRPERPEKAARAGGSGPGEAAGPGPGADGGAPPAGLVQGSRSLSHLTEEELQEFHDAYLELLHRFARGPENAPPNARPVHLRWFAVQTDED